MLSFEYKVRFDNPGLSLYTDVVAGSFDDAIVAFSLGEVMHNEVNRLIEAEGGDVSSDVSRWFVIPILIKSTCFPIGQHFEGNPPTFKERQVTIKICKKPPEGGIRNV